MAMIRSTASEIQDLIRDLPEDEVEFAVQVWKLSPGEAGPREAIAAHARTLRGEAEEFFLDYLNMRLDPDELTPEEEERIRQSREEIERGDFVTLEQLKAKYRA
jgi:hypothetical protein